MSGKLSDIWNDNFPPLNLYNCPNTHRYEQLVQGRIFKTVERQTVEKQMTKIKAPISERLASKLVAEYPNLTGVIEKQSTTTVFYSGDNPIFSMTKSIDEETGQSVVSYQVYCDEYKFKGDNP